MVAGKRCALPSPCGFAAVTDITTWGEMRRMLPAILHERFQMVFSDWETVKTEEEWENMKTTLLKFSMLHVRVIVAREMLPKKKVLLPSGWEQHNILPKGWVRRYDESASKFKYINTKNDSAEARWEFPMDCLDAIVWPDDSVTSGKELKEQLGAPPASVEDPSVVYLNWNAQLVDWVPPKASADICAVRLRVPPGPDGKVPAKLEQLKDAFDIKDDFVPILLMAEAPAERLARDGAKPVERKETLQVMTVQTRQTALYSCMMIWSVVTAPVFCGRGREARWLYREAQARMEGDARAAQGQSGGKCPDFRRGVLDGLLRLHDISRYLESDTLSSRDSVSMGNLPMPMLVLVIV